MDGGGYTIMCSDDTGLYTKKIAKVLDVLYHNKTK